MGLSEKLWGLCQASRSVRHPMVHSFVYHFVYLHVTPKGGTHHWWVKKWAGSALKGSGDIPTKHSELIHPAPLLYSNVNHKEGPGWKLLEVAAIAQAEDGCVPQV